MLVSILTQPESRVQRLLLFSIHDAKPVSILTQPESRVQPSCCGVSFSITSFNPHPARKPGATSQFSCLQASTCMFQSSPSPKAGCNLNRLGRHFSTQRCFNPHPARKPGATCPCALSPS